MYTENRCCTDYFSRGGEAIHLAVWGSLHAIRPTEYLSLFQKFCRRDRRNGGTGKVPDIPRKDIACAVPFCHGIHNFVFKVRHGAHECGMNIYALYVRKGDDLGKLFDPLLCPLCGLERLAEHIENIRSSGCKDQTFRTGFNGLAKGLVGIPPLIEVYFCILLLYTNRAKIPIYYRAI